MRLGRWLALAAIVPILVFIVFTYEKHKAALASAAPAPLAPLDTGTQGLATDWSLGQTDGDCPRFRVHATGYKQIEQPAVTELIGLELRLYQKDCKAFDLIKSDNAQFDIPGKTLYSPGEVEITMGVQEGVEPHGRMLRIKTSGAHFSTETGTATTDQPATFAFDRGGGSAVGADYDPNTRVLHMRSNVVLDLRGKSPDSKPMHAEAGEGTYYEQESRVVLSPWSKLTRGALHLDAGSSVVLLEKGYIQHAVSEMAHGEEVDPTRKVEFAGDKLFLDFGEDNLVQQIHANDNAKLISTFGSGKTTVTSSHIDLNFVPLNKESVLDTGIASGKSVAESVPTPKPGAAPADTRILRSDVIRMKMRPGGKEMDTAETDGAATLDFLPNRPAAPKRELKGDKIWIAYGAENRIQTFRSVNVSTRTDPPVVAGKPAPPPRVTRSKDFLATFDPKTGELAKVEQKTDFQYQEGDRQARANAAVLEQQTDIMTLDGGSRVWDPTGSVNGDHIVMNEKTGDYQAQGHVTSTRQPDQPDKKDKAPGMLSGDQIMQAQAQSMNSADRNRKIQYEGNVIAQQGSNRIHTDKLEIDREHKTLEAHGHVNSEFPDKAKAGQDAKPSDKSAATVFTRVEASDLVYSDDTRVAVYTAGNGAVKMVRPGLTVNSSTLQAFFKDDKSGSDSSSLEKALADGSAKIVSIVSKPGLPRRVRTATSEHAEYFADEGKVVMQGGKPLLVDSVKGSNTTGKQLTWWENKDTLLVDGDANAPAQSLIRKK
jgi:lipopolysaccharide export system protein LptA